MRRLGSDSPLVSSMPPRSKRASFGDVAVSSASLHDDIGHLRRVGQERGFPARLRRKIWPILLGADSEARGSQPATNSRAAHKDEKQVLLDTNRSFTGSVSSSLDEKSVSVLKNDLQQLICDVLRRNMWLHYYQGYHDIAQLVYLVMGSASAGAVLEQISLSYLRDFMLSTLSPSMSMLRLVHQIVRIADPDYANILVETEPYYAIPVILTWWTHTIQSHSDACRMVDFLISSEPVMIIYTIAAGTILRRNEVLACDGDQDLMFLALSQGTKGIDIEALLEHSMQLFQNIRPRQLRHWKQISAHSCLKTFALLSKDPDGPRSPEDIERRRIIALSHFESQEVELRIEEARSLAKQTAVGKDPMKLGIIAFGVSVLAVGLAWYMRQD